MATKDLKKSHNLKYLQTKLSDFRAKHEILLKESAENERKLLELKTQIQTLESEIAKLEKSGDLIFSEHAFLRYFERVLGINLDEVKEKILPQEERKKILSISKSMTYKKDNYSLKIQNGVVLTILTDDKDK